MTKKTHKRTHIEMTIQSLNPHVQKKKFKKNSELKRLFLLLYLQVQMPNDLYLIINKKLLMIS